MKSQNFDLGIDLVYSIFCQLDSTAKAGAGKKSRISFDCRSAKIQIKSNSRIHFHSVRQFAASELKLHWRSWTDWCLDAAADDPETVSSKLQVLTLWKSLASVSSNLGYLQTRCLSKVTEMFGYKYL
jgi:hypothetical protein